LGAVFGIFTGVSLWWTFITGFVFDKLFISCVFFMIFFGVNLTFFPLHFAGIHGYPRKYIDYPDIYGIWNILSSFGSLLRIFSLFLFVFLLFDSFFSFKFFFVDEFVNSGAEGVLSFFVFSHSYQRDIFFWVNLRF
jgi:heme/copper-type cytochrome/quinol oxidase subunit 1